jgi:uncharacterized membrane protein YdjX (TVP38/TMEM64 family)
MSPGFRGFDRPPKAASAWKRAIAIALVCTGLALLASSDALYSFVLRSVDLAESVIVAHPIWGISLFIILSALSAMLAFFSTAVITPVAVRTWGEPLSIVFLWAGWMIGGLCAYSVGRLLGRPVVRYITSPGALERFEQRISTRAPFGLVLLFQIALPSEVPGYVLGLVRYTFAKYLLVLAIAEIPFAVGTVYLGASFLERRTVLLIAIGITGALFCGWAFHALQKRLSA